MFAIIILSLAVSFGGEQPGHITEQGKFVSIGADAGDKGGSDRGGGDKGGGDKGGSDKGGDKGDRGPAGEKGGDGGKGKQ